MGADCEFNYGLDLGLFNNCINLAIDAYYSVTRALLFEQPTQSFTGYTHYWNNIGKVRNSGLEIQLDTHNMKSRKFSWDTNINFSLSRNKLLELGGEQQMISLGERNEGYLAKVGEPLIHSMDTRRVVYGIVRKRLQLILIFQTMHRGNTHCRYQ